MKKLLILPLLLLTSSMYAKSMSDKEFARMVQENQMVRDFGDRTQEDEKDLYDTNISKLGEVLDKFTSQREALSKIPGFNSEYKKIVGNGFAIGEINTFLNTPFKDGDYKEHFKADKKQAEKFMKAVQKDQLFLKANEQKIRATDKTEWQGNIYDTLADMDSLYIACLKQIQLLDF